MLVIERTIYRQSLGILTALDAVPEEVRVFLAKTHGSNQFSEHVRKYFGAMKMNLILSALSWALLFPFIQGRIM